MPKRTLSLGSGAGTYPALRQAVEETLLAGQRKIERDKLEVYWTTGRHIHEHLLHHEDRADYGDDWDDFIDPSDYSDDEDYDYDY